MEPRTLHQRYGLSIVLNAAGTFTPLGVSRSSAGVARAVGEALGEFFVIDELLDALSARVAAATGAEAASLVHCVAAGISLSVAAAIVGEDPARIAALPACGDHPDRVVIPAAHAVDYGHPILTDILLAGAQPMLAGDETGCGIDALEQALADERVACLLLVSSRLVRGAPIDLAAAVAAAHRRGVPAIIDGAAQDMRIDALLATGADLVLLSAHKYLAAPTAGLLLGRAAMVRAVRAQARGIGRAMKPSKEAIVGVLAALEERAGLDLAQWRDEQQRKLRHVMACLARLPGLRVSEWPDPAGGDFSRLEVMVLPEHRLGSAGSLAHALSAGRPSIRVMEHRLAEGVLALELVPLTDEELRILGARFEQLSMPGAPA